MEPNANTAKTGIYIRVSTEEQAKEGFSTRAQEEKLRGYAAARDWHVHRVYIDAGLSGKDIRGRPAIRQLIADVERKKINNVLVYKIDRLTRSTKNLIELAELFDRHGCAFNSLSESIDTSTATGRMFLKIMGIFAEFERENLAERIRLGLERKAREGYTLSTYLPSFGYSKGTGVKVQCIDPDEAATVRRVFHLYLHENYSFSQIAKTLNAEAVKGKKGRCWSDTTVKQLLTNINHIGKVRYSMDDKRRYFEAEGKHEPILDTHTFEQTQEKINRTKKITRTKRPHSEVYFCGLLYCPSCGGKYTTRWQYRGAMRYPAYRCKNAAQKTCPNIRSISHKKLERAFTAYITDSHASWPSLNNGQRLTFVQTHIKKITAHGESHEGQYFNQVIIDGVSFNDFSAIMGKKP